MTNDVFARILYTSLVDVSLPSGPGVNERGFLHDMLDRYGGRIHAVIPRPVRGLPEELHDLSVDFLPSGRSVRSLSGRARANAFGAWAVPRAIRRFSPDLVVMRPAALGLPQYAAWRVLTAPYVLKTAGDLTFRRFYERGRFRTVFQGLNEHMFRRLAHGALCIDVVSPAQRERALEVHPDLRTRVHVVDNGVDLEQFLPGRRAPGRARLGFAAADFVVGYVGNLPMERGGREVVDVVAELRSSGHAARGLVVGDTGQADACRRHAAALGVSEAVVVYGEADFSDVPELMACMDVGVSILRPHERVNSEQKVRQYLASGLCVVGTEGSNDFLQGRDFARIVGSGEVEEVTAAVTHFLHLGHDVLARLGAEARDYAEAELSIRARNDQRIALWTAAYRERIAAGASRGSDPASNHPTATR